MGKRKEKIEDPLKLLLPGAIYDYFESLNNIGAMILDKLLSIPADTTTATVQGVEMQIISADQADKILGANTKDEKTHECILKNGRFLFESKNGEHKALYKVQA